MKVMKSFRLNSLTISRIKKMSDTLDLSNAVIIEQLVDLGYEYYNSISTDMIKRDSALITERFLNRWIEFFNLYLKKQEKIISDAFLHTYSKKGRGKPTESKSSDSQIDDMQLSPNFQDEDYFEDN